MPHVTCGFCNVKLQNLNNSSKPIYYNIDMGDILINQRLDSRFNVFLGV